MREQMGKVRDEYIGQNMPQRIQSTVYSAYVLRQLLRNLACAACALRMGNRQQPPPKFVPRPAWAHGREIVDKRW